MKLYRIGQYYYKTKVERYFADLDSQLTDDGLDADGKLVTLLRKEGSTLKDDSSLSFMKYMSLITDVYYDNSHLLFEEYMEIQRGLMSESQGYNCLH